MPSVFTLQGNFSPLGMDDQNLYQEGVDFTCQGASCYSIDPTNEPIAAMQGAMNMVAAAAGTPVIAKDGVVGPNTVAVAQQLAAWRLQNMQDDADTTAIPLITKEALWIDIQNSPTPQTVYERAQWIQIDLTVLAQSNNWPEPPAPAPLVAAQAPAPAPSPATSVPSPTTSPATSPTAALVPISSQLQPAGSIPASAALTPSKPSPWPWIASAAIIVGGIGVAIVAARHPSQSAKTRRDTMKRTRS